MPSAHQALIVEDDPQARQTFESTARSLGLEVRSCADAATAWKLAQSDLPWVVLLDAALPGEEGLELCRRLRALPQGHRSVIMAITDRPINGAYEKLLHSQADDFLARPVDEQTLRVRLALASRRAQSRWERSLAEASRARTEERFQGLGRAANNAIWDWDLATNAMEWNEGLQNLFGYGLEQAPRSADWWMENIHPEDRPRVLQSLKDTLNSSDHVWSQEYLFRCGDGFYLMVEDRAYICRDANNQAVRLIGSMIDITERKQSEAKIQKLAAFPRYYPNPVLEFSADGTLTYFNEASVKLAAALGKKHPLEVLPVDFALVVREALEHHRDLRRQTVAAGRTFTWSFYPVRPLNAVHCYAEDITERVNLEMQLRQTQKLESIGQLSAGVAHDFNNILTIIQGYSTLLLGNKNLDPRWVEPITQISLAGEQAANLTRQLLLFSRKEEMRRRPLEFGEVIANMTKMLQRILGEDVQLEFTPTPGLPLIYADAGMLEQIIMNLAVNARDAMPHGGRLTISTAQETFTAGALPSVPGSRPGQFVSMSVSDTGTGIAQEHLPKIFEPFFTTKEAGKGTGLGLATVFTITKQHEGWIEVTSEVGRGTTFKVVLPVCTQLPESGAAVDPASEVPGGTETILVAEDDRALRSLTKSLFQTFGYQVLEAGNALEALGTWASHKQQIKLLVTDLILPGGLSGRDLADKILVQWPNLKVIYISGYTVNLAGQGVPLEEGRNFFQKPFQIEKLARGVRAMLDEP